MAHRSCRLPHSVPALACLAEFCLGLLPALALLAASAGWELGLTASGPSSEAADCRGFFVQQAQCLSEACPAVWQPLASVHWSKQDLIVSSR